MTKKIFVFLLLIIVFACPLNVNAYEVLICEQEQLLKLKKIASNMQMVYRINETKDDLTFEITFYNPHEDLYIKDVVNDKKYYSEAFDDFVKITGLKAGYGYTFEIRTDLYECNNKVIQTFYFNAPPYNKYYKDSICEGLTNYSLCQKWNKNLLTYDEFVRTVTIYKNSLKQDVIIEDENEKTILEKFLDAYANYYFVLFPLIIVLGGTIIYLNDKKNSFNF